MPGEDILRVQNRTPGACFVCGKVGCTCESQPGGCLACGQRECICEPAPFEQRGAFGNRRGHRPLNSIARMEAAKPEWLPANMEILAEGEYDAIVMGTGLKECILSGLLSTQGFKILHIDRNGYYGADCASLSLTDLYDKFQTGVVPEHLGEQRSYSVDLIPKFIMASGNLIKMLLRTKVTHHLEFKSVGGSYGYIKGKVSRIPATNEEALSSPLMDLMEKQRYHKFLTYVTQYDSKAPTTHQDLDLTVMTMRQLYSHFGLQPDTQDFVSHAMCLQLDDLHLDQPALPTLTDLQRYRQSQVTYGSSPYIYPKGGLRGLPEAFGRLCAVHGGTFMLNSDVDEILIDETTKSACGIRCGTKIAKARMVIGDPSYFPRELMRPTILVVRCICLLNHPIPNMNNQSAHIVIPGRQVKRKHDIFVCCVGSMHRVAPTGMYIATVSTLSEGYLQGEESVHPVNGFNAAYRPTWAEQLIRTWCVKDWHCTGTFKAFAHLDSSSVMEFIVRGLGVDYIRDHHLQTLIKPAHSWANRNLDRILGPGLALLGSITEKFTSVATRYEPKGDGASNKCFVSKSLDGASHIESEVEDLLSLYERITGSKLDLALCGSLDDQC